MDSIASVTKSSPVFSSVVQGCESRFRNVPFRKKHPGLKSTSSPGHSQPQSLSFESSPINCPPRKTKVIFNSFDESSYITSDNCSKHSNSSRIAFENKGTVPIDRKNISRNEQLAADSTTNTNSSKGEEAKNGDGVEFAEIAAKSRSPSSSDSEEDQIATNTLKQVS